MDNYRTPFETMFSERIIPSRKVRGNPENDKLNIAQARDKMKKEHGTDFSFSNVNLADLERMNGISRGKLRKIKKDSFVVKPHRNTGKIRYAIVVSGFSVVIDGFLSRGVKNSNTIFSTLKFTTNVILSPVSIPSTF